MLVSEFFGGLFGAGLGKIRHLPILQHGRLLGVQGMSILSMRKKYLHMPFYSDIGCLTGSEVTVRYGNPCNAHIGERL